VLLAERVFGGSIHPPHRPPRSSGICDDRAVKQAHRAIVGLLVVGVGLVHHWKDPYLAPDDTPAESLAFPIRTHSGVYYNASNIRLVGLLSEDRWR
jgi:hypothetical protein